MRYLPSLRPRAPRAALTALLTTLLAALALVAPASASASALPTWNYQSNYLTANPREGMNSICFGSTVDLRSGMYKWYQRMDSTTALVEQLYLGAATYRITDCLDPHNGTYTHRSYLHPYHTGWNDVMQSRALYIYSTGWHYWGSSVVPQF